MGEISDQILAAINQGSADPALTSCTNTGTTLPGDPPCTCPTRSLPPKLPCAHTKENIPRLKAYILERFATSAFNMCERQKLPLINDSIPMELHVDPGSKHYAVHTQSQVALHWQEAVKGRLDLDERLGVFRRVPLNEPMVWQHRMLIMPKSNGEPRRVVDYSGIHDACPRQTHQRDDSANVRDVLRE